MTNTDVTITQLIATSRLVKSALNVRRTGGASGLGELKASILAHGLMQNLVVTDGGEGIFFVIAGGRRLEAIHALQTEGKLSEDFAVPCQIVSVERAQELSLVENTVRLAMHPADQFEAFAALIESGHSAAEIAERFGVEETLVVKRLKLARVAPELLAEYRAEGLTLECLMAFTITDDHRRQRKVFKSLPAWEQDDPAAIRAALTEKLVEAKDKLALFVGIDAYQAAGGTIRADLFGTEVYLEKPALLNKLASQKLDRLRAELTDEGWSWIEIHPDRDYDAIHRCGRLQPRLIDAPEELIVLKARLDAELAAVERTLDETESDEAAEQLDAVQAQLAEAEERLTGYVGFDETQKQFAGCFVSIGHDGTPFVDKGLVKPEQRKALARLLGQDDRVREARGPKPAFSSQLREELAACRQQVAQLAIAGQPELALDLLIFTASRRLLGSGCRVDGPRIEFQRQSPKLRESDSAPPASQALADIASGLETAWLDLPSEGEQFEAFRRLPVSARQSLLAYCVALTLPPTLASDEAMTAYDAALALTGTEVADYWRPTASNLLGRITREQLLAIGRETLGEAWANSRAADKKSVLVSELDRAFAEPKKAGRTAGKVAALKGWLPRGMAFSARAAQSTCAGKTRIAA